MYWLNTIDITQQEALHKEEIELSDIGGGPDISMISLRGME